MSCGCMSHNDKCPQSDTGHVTLEFPEPQESLPSTVLFFGYHTLPTSMAIGDVIIIRLCSLCGLLYWEPCPSTQKQEGG